MGAITEIRKEKKIKYLSIQEEERLLNNVKNVKYKFIILLMLDAGLRVSEAVSLRVSNFDFKNSKLIVKTLKQRKGKSDKEILRTVYMTQRTITAAANYFKTYKKYNQDSYVFPASSKQNQSGYLTRKQVWRHLKERTDSVVNPHMCRHTCGTKLIETGTSPIEVQKFLGHQNIQNTFIYIHINDEKKKQAVARLEPKRKFQDFFKKYLPFLFTQKVAFYLPSSQTSDRYQIGRKNETSLLYDLIDKRVNVLLIGEQGVGKSHILDDIQRSNILRIDDTKDFKKQIAACIFRLIDATPEFQTKIAENPETDRYGIVDVDKTRHAVILELLGVDKSVISSQSAKRLCELLCKITEPNEYTIIIDRADDVTPSVIKQLEFLTNHFHFVVACRSMQVKYATWLHNFQRIKIEPLSRSETIELIVRSSEDYRNNIENFELFKTHIINKSQGVPLRILDMTSRFRKESFVSAAMVANYEVVGDLREIDMSIFFLLGLSGFMVMRYIGGELGHDEDAFRLFGAFGLLFAFFARSFFRASKRRYV